RFTYQGRSPNGLEKGEVEAADRRAAVGELRRRSILVTRISEQQPARQSARPASWKIKDRDMALFTRQFSAMVDAGLPLVQCLTILGDQSDSKRLRGVATEVARAVAGGSTLAASLRMHGRAFDDLYTHMVEVGEAGGILDVVLQRLAVYIEKAASLKRKVKSALVYPCGILGVALLVIVFMLAFVIPTFAAMFREMGAELPLPTRLVIGMSSFARSYLWLCVLVAAAGGVVALRSYRRTEQGRALVDRVLLALPVFGLIIRKVAVARFTRTLGTLVQSGVPILEALRITASTAGNRVVEQAVRDCRVS